MGTMSRMKMLLCVLVLTSSALIAHAAISAPPSTCPAGDVCLDPVPGIAADRVALDESAPPNPKQEHLAALNAEIAQTAKLIAETTAQLKLLNRKRRMMFPSKHLTDTVLAHDDFSPSASPLLKDIPLQNPPAELQAVHMCASPLISPAKGSRSIDKLRGASVLAAGNNKLFFYNALGQLFKTEALEMSPDNQVVALSAASDGKAGMIAAGTSNGTVLLFQLGSIKNTKKMDFWLKAIPAHRSGDPELRAALSHPVTAVAVQKLKKTAITYVGDAAGRIRVYSTTGKLMKLVELTNLTDVGNTRPAFVSAPAVTALHCCVNKQLIISVGQTVGLLDTSDLSLRLCHTAEETITGIASTPPPLNVVYAVAGANLLTLRAPKKMKTVSTKNESVCAEIYSTPLNMPAPATVLSLKNYLLLHSPKSQAVAVFNATKLKETAPWPVFDIELNLTGSVLISTDKQASFIVGTLGGGISKLYHTELPQLHTSASAWDMPSRPMAIGAALLLVLGYKYYSRRASGSNGRGDDDMEDLRSTGGYNKYGKSKQDKYAAINSGMNQFGRGKMDRGAMNNMHEMEKRIENLGQSTNQLGQFANSVSPRDGRDGRDGMRDRRF